MEIRYASAPFHLQKSEHLVAVEATVSSEVSTKNANKRPMRFPRRGVPLGKYEIVEAKEAEELIRKKKTFGDSDSNVKLKNVYHSSNDMVPFVPTGTIYVEFVHNVPEGSKKELAARHNLAMLQKEKDGALTLGVTNGDPVEISAALQREPIIRIAEPDLVTEAEVKNFAIPNDGLLSQLWHLENRGEIAGDFDGLRAGADARVVAAWQLMQGFGSADVVIGIIDDGFDLTHPDVGSRAIHPWDFKRNTSDVRPQPNVTSPATGDWHGTACAGVAVGALGGGKIIGAAPTCSWIPVRWSVLEPTEVVKWFEYMRVNGAWVISCSWGARARNYPLGTRISKSISRCTNEGRNGRGCVVVFAAGNEGRDVNDTDSQSVNGWASHPDVIAVSASTSTDERAPYSNYGKPVSVCAPSSGARWAITTADVVGEFIDSIGVSRPLGYVPGDYNEHFGKTSSACPLVAGICGLMLSVNSQLTASEVRSILQKTARRIGDPSLYDMNGHSSYFGYGCVNAVAAVAEAMARIPSA